MGKRQDTVAGSNMLHEAYISSEANDTVRIYRVLCDLQNSLISSSL